MSLREEYCAAISSGNAMAAARIERDHKLYGYSQDIVLVGLAAADKGEDVEAAVEAELERQHGGPDHGPAAA